MLTKNLKKLTYRLQYRGTKELDVFFRKASLRLPFFTQEDVALLEMLIEENESFLQGWVCGLAPIPPKYKNIFAKLLT
jgi:succinate dehydrogenase flavin-adding protein (antitoxin of CptAB toxin-antitoxin module)